jgi:hypothetical protein
MRASLALRPSRDLAAIYNRLADNPFPCCRFARAIRAILCDRADRIDPDCLNPAICECIIGAALAGHLD